MREKTIIEDLSDLDYRVRMRTIHTLVQRGHAEAIQLLLPLLNDREMLVRCAAMIALGTFADRQIFDSLVPFLASTVSLERKNAVQALVTSEDPRRRDAFLDALKTETNLFVRVQLIKALSVFHEEKVFEMLIEQLTDQDEDIRAIAAIALGKMGQPCAIPALQQMVLTDTNEETSIHGLCELNSTIAKRAIQMILHPEQEQNIDWPDIVDL